jgi:hypothetical protein
MVDASVGAAGQVVATDDVVTVAEVVTDEAGTTDGEIVEVAAIWPVVLLGNG